MRSWLDALAKTLADDDLPWRALPRRWWAHRSVQWGQIGRALLGSTVRRSVEPSSAVAYQACVFDALARGLAQGVSRRDVLKGLGAVAAGTAVLSMVGCGTSGTAEKCVTCGRQCVFLSSNPDHCGSCGKRCAEDEFCGSGGTCYKKFNTCPETCCANTPTAPFSDCPQCGTTGSKTNLGNDLSNCGLCGRHCETFADSFRCIHGHCTFCPESWTYCPDGACALLTDLSADGDHCGSCDHACGPWAHQLFQLAAQHVHASVGALFIGRQLFLAELLAQPAVRAPELAQRLRFAYRRFPRCL